MCIRPEVSRTKTFGFTKGVSKGEFSAILKLIKLNEDKVDWSTIDLNYLLKVCMLVLVSFPDPTVLAWEGSGDETMLVYHDLV